MARSCVGGEGPAVAADAQHEVLVVELVRLERARCARRRSRACAACTGPTSASGRAGRPGRSRRSPCAGVDVLDPRADVQAVVVLLEPLVGVQRLDVTERPLALAPGRPGGARWYVGRRRRESHGGRLLGEGRTAPRQRTTTTANANARAAPFVGMQKCSGRQVSRKGDTTRWTHACGRRDVEPQDGGARTWTQQ